LRPVELVHRAMLRSARGPLRALWQLAYEGAVRWIAACLRWRARDVAVYAVGSLGRGEPVYGLSDLDLVVVAPRDATRPGRRRERLGVRRDRLLRALPGSRELAADVEVCEDHELGLAVAETALTHGLNGDAHPATILVDTGWSRVAGLQERPGIGRPLDAWRLVAGPDRRPAAPPADAGRRRIAAWLELQHWWRYAFGGCLHPDGPRTPYLCVKLVSEPVRAWLWLDRGEAVVGRREALLRGLRALPEEEAAIRRVLELEAGLDRFPQAPLADALGLLARLTTRVAGQLAAAAELAGATEVRLVGESEELALPALLAPRGLLPLADWRAIVAPRLPDEALEFRPGDPGDPRAVAVAARAAAPGVAPALVRGPLVVFPTGDTWAEAILRGAQCPVTDPVTHALLARRRSAAFAKLPGWAVDDVARRAVAEHAAWLRLPASPPRRYARVAAPPPVVTLGRLLTAARAALLVRSLERGEPTLAITVSAIASIAEGGQLEEAIEHGRDALVTWHRERRRPSNSTVAELRSAVLSLPAYSAARKRAAPSTTPLRSAGASRPTAP
jgi:Nucleotidyltransferase domain